MEAAKNTASDKRELDGLVAIAEKLARGFSMIDDSMAALARQRAVQKEKLTLFSARLM